MTIEDIVVGMTDGGRLDYAAMLDGEVEVNITFGTDGVTLTITQTPY